MEKRLVELEIKVTFQEKTIEELNGVLVDQQKQIDLLARKVKDLQEQLRSLPDSDPAPDPLPPHY